MCEVIINQTILTPQRIQEKNYIVFYKRDVMQLFSADTTI